ncbi:hypothetical protein C0991_007649, partial [Blastosporella zonata]
PWSSPSSIASLSSNLYTGAHHRRVSTSTTGTASSGSGATITPSLFARGNDTAKTTCPSSTPNTPPEADVDPFATFPPPPARGHKLFFTSAKTGAGVADVFEYIARRVVRRWEYEERMEARRMHVREARADDHGAVQLELAQRIGRGGAACCAS